MWFTSTFMNWEWESFRLNEFRNTRILIRSAFEWKLGWKSTAILKKSPQTWIDLLLWKKCWSVFLTRSLKSNPKSGGILILVLHNQKNSYSNGLARLASVFSVSDRLFGHKSYPRVYKIKKYVVEGAVSSCLCKHTYQNNTNDILRPKCTKKLTDPLCV